MNNFDFVSKVLLSLTLLALFATPVMAEWDVSFTKNGVITDGSNIYFSEGENSVVFAQIETDRGEPVNASSLTDSSQVIFNYNKSDGEDRDMQYLDNGIWYAEFTTDETKHGVNGATELMVEAQGDRDTTDGVDSGGWKTATKGVDVGNYTVNLQQNPEEELIPGEEIEMSVNVTRRNDSANVNNSDVYGFFRNSTISSIGNEDEIDFVYNSTTELYEADVTVPENYDSKYLMRVLAINRSNPIQNAYGSTSTFIDTATNLEGEVAGVNPIRGCLEDRDPVDINMCEPGGELNLTYNVTAGSPDSVEATMYKMNRSTGDRQVVVQESLDKKGPLYSSQVEIPDLNTTAFAPSFTLEFNMTKGDRSIVEEEDVIYNSIFVDQIGTRSALQGSDYRLAVQPIRPYSLTPWGESRLQELEATVIDSQEEIFGDYNMSNFTFDQEDRLFETQIAIPEDASTGRWDIDINATDVYGRILDGGYVDSSAGFSVASSDQTFNVSETTFEKEEEGTEEFNLTVENRKSDPITLETNLSESLEGELEVNDSLELESGMQNITITTNMSSFESIEGNLTLTDSNTDYSQTVNLAIDVASCQFSSGDLCSLDGKWVNVTADERGNFTEEIELRNTAEDGNVTNVTTNITGNISEVMNLKENYSVEGDHPVQINFSVEEIGNYTGSVTFNGNNSTDDDNATALTFLTSLETTFEEETEPGLNAPSELELGAVPEGTNVTEEVEIENTGAVKAENVTADSNEFTLSLNSTGLNISGGESEAVNLTFEQLISEEGTVNITANSSEGQLLTSMDVNATTLENYSARTAELESRIEELRPVRGGNLTNTLTEVSNSIESIKANWSEGNYMAARNLFEEGDNRLDYVSDNKETSSESDDEESDDSGDDSGDTGSQEGDTGGESDPGTGEGDSPGTGGNQQQQDNGGGGIPWVPIIGVLVLLIIVGVVVYESYIPEEGDPLYGVLGDK